MAGSDRGATVLSTQDTKAIVQSDVLVNRGATLGSGRFGDLPRMVLGLLSRTLISYRRVNPSHRSTPEVREKDLERLGDDLRRASELIEQHLPEVTLLRRGKDW